MSLPRAVLEAEQRADELLKQLNQAKSQQPPEGEVVANDQEPKEEQAQSVAAPAEPSNTEKPAEAPAAQEDPTWESRYKSLIGKYNAEVPRLAASNKELTAKLQSIEKELEDLRTAKAEPKQSLVKPEEIQEFGEPLVDLIRRAARDEVSEKDQEIAALRARLERFEVSNSKTAEVDFFARLSSAVPDWEETNKNDGFINWLAEYDELTGLQRQDALDDAVRNNDAIRAARFFNKWSEINKTKAETASRSLEEQVVPTPVANTAPPAGKKIWTRSEIQDFYGKVRRGEVSDKDMVSIEADIHAAHIEKRIR
jgi:vacuolar-type H+-ATPase subunit I/STV1